MKKANELMKKFTTDLEDFRNLTVSYDQTVSLAKNTDPILESPPG